jgi:oligoribonuclease
MTTLLWLDLETTGLDPRRDAILEVAVAFATLDAPFDVSSTSNWVVFYPRSAQVDLSPFILDMHGKNGLLEACAAAVSTRMDVQRVILGLLSPAASKEDAPILAGSSVHFDHEFLKVHMPALAKAVSHRHYDVSAVKLFCQSLGMPKLPKAEAHRAAADIVESIAHARSCAFWLAHNWMEKG